MDIPISEQVPDVLQHADDDVLSTQTETSASSLEATSEVMSEESTSDEPHKQHEQNYGWYTFTWDQPAGEVYVTGSFDNWTKSVKLTNQGGIFKTEVMLPKESTMYEFIVDGKWMVNTKLRTKPFGTTGLAHNFLSPEDIIYNEWTARKHKAARRTVQGIEFKPWPQYSWQKDLVQGSNADDINPAYEFMDGVIFQTAEDGDQILTRCRLRNLMKTDLVLILRKETWRYSPQTKRSRPIPGSITFCLLSMTRLHRMRFKVTVFQTCGSQSLDRLSDDSSGIMRRRRPSWTLKTR
jgi:hypothetical protein